MQPFMQSLQMRWPVAASIGLSTTIIASAAIAWPSFLSVWNSEIRSSSGQPASSLPKAERLNTTSPSGPGLSRRPFEHESLPCLWQRMQ